MSLYNMLISRKKIEYIAHNLVITNHAKQRIMERLGCNVDIRQLILNSPFWFRDVDESIVISIDQQRYFVIAENNNTFKLITIKEPSENGYDIMDKFVLAYSRKERERKESN